MAKGKSGKSGTRDPSESLPSVRSRPRPYSSSPLTLIEDHRSFSFAPATRPARLFNSSVASITVTPATKKAGSARSARSRLTHAKISFTAPRQTIVCVRRSRRRQVLHALKKTGKRGQRRPRRKQWSHVSC